MSGDTKDVQLRIRARDESGKTLDQTVKRVEELGKALDAQQAAAKRGEAGVKELDASYRHLENTVKALIGQDALIKNFERHQRALEGVKARVTAARAAQEAYAATLTAGAEPTAAQTRHLDRLARAVAIAERAQQQHADKLTKTGAALRAAGIDTNNLAAAQARIAGAVGQGNAALDRQAAAIHQLDASASQYNRTAANTLAGGRAGVSMFGGLRTAVMGAVAAYLSLHQAASQARGAIAATADQQAIESRLAVALETNDTATIGKEFDYLREKADYFGMGVRELAKDHGSFAIAAKSAGMENQRTRYIFEQLAGGMRVMKLNTDQSGRAWTQLVQILSKAKPEMEDVKTVAESGWAGVQGTMARGLLALGVAGIRAGSETADIFALMRKGALDSKTAIEALAVGAEKELGGRLPEAIKSLVAEQGRFENAVFDFQKLIAASGWADAYQAALRSISEFLKSNDGQAFAASLGQAFAAAADAAIFLMRHLDEVVLALKLLGGAWVALKLRNGIAEILDAANALRGMGGAVGAVQKAFLLLQALLAGWSIGTYLNDQFVEVRRFGIALVTGFQEIWVQIVGGAEIAFADLPRLMRNAGAAMVNAVTFALRKVLGLVQSAARALGQTSFADAVGAGIANMTATIEAQADKVADIRARMAKDIQAIHDIGLGMWKDADRKPAATPKAPTSPTGRPDTRTGQPSGPSDAEIAKRARAIEAIQRQLESLGSSIERAAGQSLASQLDAVDTQYAKLARDVAALGKTDPQAVAFAAELARLIGEKKLGITRQYNEKLMAEAEALNSKIEGAEAAAGRKDKANLDARLTAIATRYAGAYREIEAYRRKLHELGVSDEPAQLMRERLDLGVQELQHLERKKYAQEQLNERERLFNDLIAQRNAQVGAVKAQQETGLITEADAAGQVNAINAQLIPAIQAAAEATRQWAIANAGIFPSPEAQATFIASLDAMTVKATAAQGAFTTLDATIARTLADSATTAIDKIAQSLGGLVSGTMSWRDALKGATGAIANMFAEMLRGIAMQMVKQQMLNAVLAISKALGWGGVANAATSMGAVVVAHDGAVIGRPGGRQRRIEPGAFANAVRYHTGGVVGLRPNEVPSILEKSEEVLTRDDPRHVLNGGKNAGGGGGGGSNRFVLVDDRSRVAEAMASAEGESVTMVHLRRNVATLKQMLKG